MEQELRAGQLDRAALLQPEDMQVVFDIGDRVQFCTAGGRARTGTVEKFNPKRARVRCDDGVWNVPYAGLDLDGASTATDRRTRARRLQAVAVQARGLMDGHGLKEWSLRFSAARKKLGECRPNGKLILLSRAHAVNSPPDRVTDTILHEIAHALAGPTAHHGPAWKAIARRLGATPKSCAPESDEVRRRRETAKARFRAADAVSFVAGGERHSGVIVRMNPKRAKVRCGDVAWSVPYTGLSPVSTDRSGRNSSDNPATS